MEVAKPRESLIMGDKKVTANYSAQLKRDFTLAVLEDLDALAVMLAKGMIETGTRRIGAEQEFFLIDGTMHR
jgi:hypothetical protein